MTNTREQHMYEIHYLTVDHPYWMSISFEHEYQARRYFEQFCGIEGFLHVKLVQPYTELRILGEWKNYEKLSKDERIP